MTAHTSADMQSRPLTPRDIVRELDKYIVGQNEAKKAVAIALRNRWRRQQIPAPLQDEITPKNIIMMGPTGVGKTEIARRLANLAQAPFTKVEATKFTEVGYVGRDVDSMVRDLTEMAVQQAKISAQDKVREKASGIAEKRLLDLLMQQQYSDAPAEEPAEEPETKAAPDNPADMLADMTKMLNRVMADGKFREQLEKSPLAQFLPSMDELQSAEDDEVPAVIDAPDSEVERLQRAKKEVEQKERFRAELQRRLRTGDLDDEEIEMDAPASMGPQVEIFSSSGIEEMGFNFKDMFGNMFGGGRTRKRRIKTKDALELLTTEEAQKLIDMEEVVRQAVVKVEQSGIIFIDEIDKVAGRRDGHSGPDVSREGVQRDILPLVEGSTVMTKYGPVKSHHILFIAAGAFHISKPSDLIPELQGRFPIRVELDALTAEDFQRILTEPENSLVRQYREMMDTEGVTLEFTDAAIKRIAEIAFSINERNENIGARRLYTVMEKLLEEVSFEAPDMGAGTIPVTPEYINTRLKALLDDEDLSKYIL